MSKIGIIGSSDSVLGFGALGFDVFETDDAGVCEKTLRSLAQNDYAVIFITEKLYSQCEQLILEYEQRMLPAVIPLPSAGENPQIGAKNLSRYVERAVGSDILS